MEKQLKLVYEPVRVGPLEFKNRMIMSPMWTRYASVNGEVTQQLIDYYTARAKSGIAMIIQESTAVDGRHVWKEPEIRIDEDRYLPGLHRLVEAVHAAGALIFVQLHHVGMFGTDPIAPSDVPSWGVTEFEQPRAMTIAEIEEARECFINAAYKAMEAGYDGVELHGATSYLLQQFTSPHTNKRTDKYGGSPERRATLAREIIQGIKRKCGPNFPVGYTTVCDELLADGIKMEEAVGLARRLQREGIVYIHFLPGTYETLHYEQGRGTCQRQKRGEFDYTRTFKDALNIRVFARTMAQNDPYVWEEALKIGDADGVVIGRANLCDHDFPRKILENRLEDIRPCIRCNYCYESGVAKKYQLACSINPELGYEREFAITGKVADPRKVVVVGGGPAGMEAARVAARRGHKVTLLEKEAVLGGTMLTASLPIGKEELKPFVEWQERQCRAGGVTFKLNTEATPEAVKELKPDVVIIAAGASPLIPDIPGVNKPHVVLAEDVLKGNARVGNRVIVVGGRGQTGPETADFIVEKGLAKSVTIIARSNVIAADMNPTNRAHFMQVVWPKLGIKVLTNMDVIEITDKGVIAMDRQWQKHPIEVDTVVLARGYTPNRTLHEALKGQATEIHSIGDCVKPRNIRAAVFEGAYIGRQI
ncbi:MAG: FAD-dependent oxidoreductase [Chloroflexi bacterium]|nr:FAD-dependent oxidoreductase [Chloroflexota bacterium]